MVVGAVVLVIGGVDGSSVDVLGGGTGGIGGIDGE